ncbi:hypothetical protein OG196_44125 (plasmid) [Kitasatospora purpeofusca]|uniref:hypothetical protein n=1 Tax=Kitasatospora purpeofusca TaxID=67352 RepID=UPI002E12CD5F|nr:hypothetical protein OG196_44125 [Kitasatospora purpeofusca]
MHPTAPADTAAALHRTARALMETALDLGTPPPATPPPRRPRSPRRPAPAADQAVALTVRVDPDEATAIDLWLLGLRDDAHRTRLDKAEAIRELLRLAREHEPTRRALLKRLT